MLAKFTAADYDRKLLDPNDSPAASLIRSISPDTNGLLKAKVPDGKYTDHCCYLAGKVSPIELRRP